MNRFAELLDRLVLTSSRNAKLRLMEDYFRGTADPDRGYALASLAGDLSFASVKPGVLRTLAMERMDPVLFAHSYDYVGDLAETLSLIWPAPPDAAGGEDSLPLSAVVEALQKTSRSDAPAILAALLDRLDTSGRFAVIKLVTGGLRIGVSARLVKQALANFGGRDIAEIEELWHGLEPPYRPLFAWLEGSAEKPSIAARALFRPVMLANALQEADADRLDPADYAAEW
jgi:DNA ligase-1